MQRMIFFFMPRQIPTPGELSFRRGVRRLDDAVLGLLRRRRKTPAPGRDLLTILLDTRDPATGEPLVDRHVRDEIVTLFFPGHESTGLVATWMLYRIAEMPDVIARLRAEADAVLDGRRATLADLPRLKYTKRVAQETLRRYPPGWLMPRLASEDCVVDGYEIPKGAFLAVNLYALHRDPQLWDRPDELIPERFDGGESKWPRGQYIPFGGAPRLCIGDQFALMKAQFTLAMFVQRFVPSLAGDSKSRPRGMGGSLQPRGDLMLHCAARN